MEKLTFTRNKDWIIHNVIWPTIAAIASFTQRIFSNITMKSESFFILYLVSILSGLIKCEVETVKFPFVFVAGKD